MKLSETINQYQVLGNLLKIEPEDLNPIGFYVITHYRDKIVFQGHYTEEVFLILDSNPDFKKDERYISPGYVKFETIINGYTMEIVLDNVPNNCVCDKCGKNI